MHDFPWHDLQLCPTHSLYHAWTIRQQEILLNLCSRAHLREVEEEAVLGGARVGRREWPSAYQFLHLWRHA